MRRKQIETKFTISNSNKEYWITFRGLISLHISAFLYLDILFVRVLYK